MKNRNFTNPQSISKDAAAYAQELLKKGVAVKDTVARTGLSRSTIHRIKRGLGKGEVQEGSYVHHSVRSGGET